MESKPEVKKFTPPRLITIAKMFRMLDTMTPVIRCVVNGESFRLSESGSLWHIYVDTEKRDYHNSYFIRFPKLVLRAVGMKDKYQDVVMYGRFINPGEHALSVHEILSQIPEDIADKVNGFELLENVVEDYAFLEREREAFEAGYHATRVRLWERTEYPDRWEPK
jgi:hypothetical protein